MSSKKELEEIKKAEEFARNILARRVRKGLGEYYILWSTYSLLLGFLYNMFSFYVPSLLNSSVYEYIVFGILMIYVVYTMYIFYKVYKKREILTPVTSKKRNNRKRLGIQLYNILYYAPPIIIVSVFVYLLFTTQHLFAILSALGYSILISYMAYRIAKDTNKVMWYDYLALSSFIISSTLGQINYAFYLIYTFTWIYAGVRSIIDSYEGGESE